MKGAVPIGLGLVGLGRHGARYAAHVLKDVPGARLAGVARRNIEEARRQAEDFGCAAYADYRDLIAAPGVDAVAVVVPPVLHPEIVAAAARAGKAILLEKPAALDVSVGREIRRVTAERGVPVMVAQTLRYSGVVQTLFREKERLGRIHYLRLGQHFEPSLPGWIDDPVQAGGGIILNTGVHSFDLIRMLTEMEPDRASCEMTTAGRVGYEDNFAAVFRLQEGAALAAVGGSRATASRSGGIELAGEHGQLVADHVMNTASFIEGRRITPLEVPAPVPTVRETLLAFTRALREDMPMPVSLEDGLRAVAMAEACYASARTGRSVPVPGID